MATAFKRDFAASLKDVSELTVKLNDMAIKKKASVATVKDALVQGVAIYKKAQEFVKKLVIMSK